MRLQKYLAHAGVASRRKAEEFISAGHVRVNGRTVRELGTSVEPNDRVELAGKLVRIPETKRYVVLNKPEKVMTTMRDPAGRRTVASLVPREGGRVVPVGRLDYDTSGVLLLTNDGELAHVLTHPKFGVEKTYRAVVSGRLQGEDMKKFLAGMRLDDGRSRPAKVRVVRVGPGGIGSRRDHSRRPQPSNPPHVRGDRAPRALARPPALRAARARRHARRHVARGDGQRARGLRAAVRAAEEREPDGGEA